MVYPVICEGDGCRHEGLRYLSYQIRINRSIQPARKAHLAALEPSTILRIASGSRTTICILSHSPESARFNRVWYYPFQTQNKTRGCAPRASQRKAEAAW